MRRLFWFVAFLWFAASPSIQGQNLGHAVVAPNIVHISPVVPRVEVHPTNPLVVHVPRLSRAQVAPLANAFTPQYLYSPYYNPGLNPFTRDLYRTVPAPKQTNVSQPGTSNKGPLGTTIETQNLDSVLGYTVSEVRKVQESLRRLGYYSGEIDGTFGTNTQKALETYQIDTGQPVTGTLSKGVLSRLGVGK